MNFKSEQDIKRLRSLADCLNRPMHETHKNIILKKLKAIFSHRPLLDSDPVDVYRIIGLASVKIQLIEEVNKMIAEHTTSYMMVIPWVKELYQVWMNYQTMKEQATIMALALLSQGNYTGFYKPEKESELKS